MTKKTTTNPAPWLTEAAANQTVNNYKLRRKIEDYFGKFSYSFVNTCKMRKSKNLTHPAIIKLIAECTGLTEAEILQPANPSGHE
jgi:hypothetical protein